MQAPRHRPRRPPSLNTLLPLVLALSAASCRSAPSRKTAPAPAANKATVHALKEELGKQSSQLVEKDAQIKRLEQWLLSQQRMLDDAMQEVVRVQAKQRSLESRAEAASEIAEAEIALKSLRDQTSETDRPEAANAAQLLTRATGEFEKQNFGGALYLVRQAKSQIKRGELGLGEPLPARERDAEMPFVVPISLVLIARGNLREGPGQEFKVLVTLDAGARLTGYFTKGPWIRVESDGGHSGWIRRSLVSPY